VVRNPKDFYPTRMPKKRRRDRRPQYDSNKYQELQRRVAANLRRIRADRGLTQEATAAVCGMSTRLYQRCEAGDANTTLTTLARLAEGLEVDFVDLFFKTE
jgi:DNA-binding XRE family transcriptional regulator